LEKRQAPNEVYIAIPAWIHKSFPNFFPKRDMNFKLHLPNKKTILAKVCQENNKALMSNPNKDLGKWILRDILKLKEGELVTYKMLEEIGIDSIEIIKTSEGEFYINFKELGEYGLFKRSNDLKFKLI